METFTLSGGRTRLRTLCLAALSLVALACSNFALADPIHDAARKGDVKKIKAMIAADPKVVSVKDSLGDTPLHLAAKYGEVEAAQALLDAGADVNAKNNYGAFTPDQLGGILYSKNHEDPVKLLTVQGLDTRDNQNGYTPLDLAMFSIRHKPMVELLVSKGANVNARSSSGSTPLYWAVLRGQKDDVLFLLGHGADVNVPDAYGNTILDCALHLQYGSMIQLLIDKGADVNAKDQSEHRPLYYALQMDDHKWADMLTKHGAHD